MSPFRITVASLAALVVGASGLVGLLEWSEEAGPLGLSVAEAGRGTPYAAGGTGGATGPTTRKQVLTVNRIAGYTPVVTNAQGRVIYRYDEDSSGPSRTRCVAECARVWQPVLAGPDGVEVRSSAIEPALIGTLTRANGTEQVTLNGWPLYYHSADRAAGQISGHARDGLWWAVSPDGTSAAMVPAGSSTDRFLDYY